MVMPPTVISLKEEMRLLEIEIADIKDRLSVVEEQSGINRNMIDEASDRMDALDDRMDKEL